MPRILPRLVKIIEKQAGQPEHFPFPKRPRTPKSHYKPPLPKPSFRASHYERSILLAPQSPVTNKSDYAQHKRLPPTLSRHKLDPEQVDPPRQMTDQEFGWWSNPYLRILSSPLRLCLSSGRPLPTDLLVRLVGLRMPASDTNTSRKQQTPLATISPDGILHPKYVSRKSGGGFYVLCWRKAIENLQKGGYKRISPQLSYPTTLLDQIAHLLRLRVLQEFELLAERLEHAMNSGKNLGPHGIILRRLTRDEWGSMSSTGVIPYPTAVAVLVIPPPNKDPVTKERPQPSMSALPPEDEDCLPDAPPPMVLMPVCIDHVQDPSGVLPQPQVPLYNSITAFPSRSQRAALHALLLRILTAERFAKRLHIRWGKATPWMSSKEDKNRSPSKMSHAFVVSSDGGTARRGDSAAIARALWRLGMYDSAGWSKIPQSPST